MSKKKENGVSEEDLVDYLESELDSKDMEQVLWSIRESPSLRETLGQFLSIKQELQNIDSDIENVDFENLHSQIMFRVEGACRSPTNKSSLKKK